MNVALWLERAGKADLHRPAIGYGRRVVRTYAELAAGAARLAAAMRAKLGLAPGERVAVIAKNCPEYVEIPYGLWWAGLAAVPANAKLHGAELGYVLEHSGAKLCFATPELESDLAAHAPPTLERLIVIGSPAYAALLEDDPIAAPIERGPDDLAWLFYTSGTTGRPKGAMLTHGNLASAAHAYLAEVDPVAPGDGLLHAAPPRLRPLHLPARDAPGRQRGARIRRLRPGGDF
jgi:long-chain acyl-CoA synthetase